MNEIQEIRVVAGFQHLSQIPGARWPTVLPFPGETAVQHDRPVGRRRDGAVPRITLRADELLAPFRGLQQMRRRHAQQLDDTGQLVRLVLARQQRETGDQLHQDAAEAPHVDRHAVLSAEDHLRGAIKAALNVRVDALVLVAARTKVYHLRKKNKKKKREISFYGW